MDCSGLNLSASLAFSSMDSVGTSGESFFSLSLRLLSESESAESSTSEQLNSKLLPELVDAAFDYFAMWSGMFVLGEGPFLFRFLVRDGVLLDG